MMAVISGNKKENGKEKWHVLVCLSVCLCMCDGWGGGPMQVSKRVNPKVSNHIGVVRIYYYYYYYYY